jgi:hypothetical protein
MISHLASPSVCVIDEDPADYTPILAALNGLFVSCVHILGNDLEMLPNQPFQCIRLVFLDLHLSSGFGKVTASHTANVFMRVVSSNTAPVLVVIWSKYAADAVVEEGVPPEDQETEAKLFQRMLLEAEPKYKGRLIFVEMVKPKRQDQPGDWADVLKSEIAATLSNQAAVDLLWRWDKLVKEATVGVGAGLTSLAQVSASQSGAELKDSLAEIMQRLAKAQGGGDYSPQTAARHLGALLAQLLVDHLQQLEQPNMFSPHGDWLGVAPTGLGVHGLSGQINGLLLTVGISANAIRFIPGTIYRANDDAKFTQLFGKDFSSLVRFCCDKTPPSPIPDAWLAAAKPILIELSPECDVAQGHRSSAMFVGGIILPATIAANKIKKAESLSALPPFYLRQAMPDYQAQDSVVIFCHRYKATIPVNTPAEWIEPWVRLRELPTASLRNLHAGQSSRVGYVSMG